MGSGVHEAYDTTAHHLLAHLQLILVGGYHSMARLRVLGMELLLGMVMVHLLLKMLLLIAAVHLKMLIIMMVLGLLLLLLDGRVNHRLMVVIVLQSRISIIVGIRLLGLRRLLLLLLAATESSGSGVAVIVSIVGRVPRQVLLRRPSGWRVQWRLLLLLRRCGGPHRSR